MDYTREPIIESVITAREGCKLVIRSSKGMSQEEYFIDAVELITFGSALFYRSLEKPKPFLLPVQDYEVVEVREARMVLKNVGIDRSLKVVSKEKPAQQQKQPPQKPQEQEVAEERQHDDKKRQKRANRRRGKGQDIQEEQPQIAVSEEESIKQLAAVPSPSALSALLAPPTTLISETLTRYRRDEAFKQAFYEKEEDAEETLLTESIPTSEEFDEGDHIIFRGHETQADFKPYSEEQEPQEDPFNLKEEYTQPNFDQQEEHL